ncbi:MAG: hypothetical protein QM820_31715 [Minicystis sp.]
MKLDEDAPALAVHGARHRLPAAHLGLVEEARDAGVTEAVGGGRGALRDDEAGLGALGVVRGHDLAGHVADRPVAGHRRHDDAVPELDAAEPVRGEQKIFGHSISLFRVRGTEASVLFYTMRASF